MLKSRNGLRVASECEQRLQQATEMQPKRKCAVTFEMEPSVEATL